MKILRHFWQDKLYQSIIRLILLVLVPAVALGGYTYMQARQSALYNTEQIIERQLTYAVQRIDKQLEELVSLYQILASNQELFAMEMLAQSDAKDVVRMRNVSSLLDTIISTNGSINEAFIYNGHDKVVSSSGIFPADYYLTDYRQVAGYSVETWNTLLEERTNLQFLPTAALLEKQENRYTELQVIPVVKTFTMSNDNGIVVFLLDTALILDEVEKYMPFATIYCAIDGPDGTIAADEAPSEQAYIHFSYASSQNSWLYSVSISQRNILAKSSATLWQVLLTVLAILTLGTILAFKISRNLYRPLHNIQSLLDTEEKNSARNLAQLEAQIEQMAKTSHTDNSQLHILAHNYVEDALLSQSITEKKAMLLQTIMTSHLGFHKGPYQCVAVHFTKPETNVETAVRDVFAKYFPTCSINYNERTILLIIEIDTVHSQAIIAAAASELFHRLPNTITGVAVGCEIMLYQNLYKSFNTSLTVLQHMDQTQRNALLFSDNFDISNQYVFAHKDEWALLEALQRNESVRLHHLLDGILLTNYEKCVSYQQMQQLFEQLRNTAYRYARHRQQSIPPHAYKRIPSLDAMREEVHTLYEALLADRTSQACSTHILLTEDADAYIQQHYTEDIYLDTIADALKVSAKHLSKTYKQQRSINITDHLTYVRVEHAKMLLKESDMTIADIMSNSGFVSRATFLRNFKRYTDISPSVYRQLYHTDADMP